MTQARRCAGRTRRSTDPTRSSACSTTPLVLRLGLVDDGRPYVVPLNFGREGDALAALRCRGP